MVDFKAMLDRAESNDKEEYVFSGLDDGKTQLNQDQLEALSRMIDFSVSEDKSKRFFGLFGAAGTGKSTVVRHYIQALRRQLGFRARIGIAAPTHKALSVLRKMNSSYNGELHYATIHSMLAIKRKINRGEETFEPDPYADKSIMDMTHVIVDECSMIGSDLYEYIKEVASVRWGPKVIFIGDKYQLPPVGENDISPTFSVPSFELTEVVRHAGCIFQIADRFRKSVDGGRLPQVLEDDDGCNKIVVYNNYKHWMSSFLDDVKNEEDCYCFAFTNDRVDQINKYVRSQVYGENALPFVNGEVFVTNGPVLTDSGDISIPSNFEVMVIEASPYIHLDHECWKLFVIPQHGRDRTEKKIYSCDNTQQKELDLTLKHFARKKDWSRFWPLKDSFSSLRPRYATTVHKSQGSTYEKVFVDHRNIMKAAGTSTQKFMRQLLYVALSRASKELHIIL